MQELNLLDDSFYVRMYRSSAWHGCDGLCCRLMFKSNLSFLIVFGMHYLGDAIGNLRSFRANYERSHTTEPL